MNDRERRHKLLKYRVQRALERLGWERLYAVNTGAWESQIDMIFHHPRRGQAGVVCHVKERDTYCLRQAQADACADWDSPVFIVYSDKTVIDGRKFRDTATLEKYDGHKPFYRYDSDGTVYSFEMVFA